VLFALKPVTFKYNSDKTNTPQFGLIAEEVAAVNPDLVLHGKTGIDTVRYEQINAMLLNEFLKEHQKVEEQQANIAELKSTVAQQQKGMEVLTAQLKEQAAQIQRVSAQVEMGKPAPKTIANK
jgi:septal ring factor EnvC (AmiA/AmiB activator)